MNGFSPVDYILDGQASIPDRIDAALVIRHAEREEIPIGTFGVDVPLTAHGVVSAAQLGNALGAGRQVSVTSSPVPRCVQTAEAILQGCNNDSPVQLDRTLGDPGPFVVDPEASGPLFLETDILDIVRRQLSGSEPPAGMRPTADGVGMLIELVALGLGRSGRVNVFVTHDSILAVLVASTLGKSADQIGWPDFLDGLLLWRSRVGLNVAWRGARKVAYPLGG